MIDSNLIWNGYTDYKDLVYSDEFYRLKIKHAEHYSWFVAGVHCYLRGDIQEVTQKYFMEGVTLNVLFDNKKDAFGLQYCLVDAPSGFDFKSGTHLIAEVELEDEAPTGYPRVKLIGQDGYNFFKMPRLQFPHYVCPECGTDYGCSKDLAETPEYQYFDICVRDLVPIYTREEYRKLKKNKTLKLKEA